jgi:peptidyl-prolyl cis-trans isomerase C
MKHTLIRAFPDGPRPDAFSGCGHGPAPAASRAATAPPIFVNGVAIAETAIAQEAQNHDAEWGPEARAAAARALVIRELLLQRARELELAPAPALDAQGREETTDEALVRRVLELEAPAPAPTEEECRRVYAAACARIKAPASYIPPYETAAAAIRESLNARAWAASSVRYVLALAAAAKIEGLSLSFGALEALP